MSGSAPSIVADSALPVICSAVAGRPAGGNEFRDVADPATGSAVARLQLADETVVAAAVSAARTAFAEWSETPPAIRARHLIRLRNLIENDRAALARMISREHGKTIADALGSIQRGIEVVEYAMAAPQLLKGEYSDLVGTGVTTRSSRRPLGVCVGITPFNYPAMIPLWMFPLALACGNTFVLKPSEKTPSAANRLAELVDAAGVPAGVFNVVHGDGRVAQALVAHPDVAAVSFVGSTQAAQSVYSAAARHGKRVQALGGAKNHAIVLPDADLDLAVDGILNGAFNSAGQRCMAISVVVAVGGVGKTLVPRLLSAAAGLHVGPGEDPRTFVPPVTGPEQRARVLAAIETGLQDGARLVLDGRNVAVPLENRGGCFVGPCVFVDVTSSMSVYREEIFGPVLCVMEAPDLASAIAMSNSHALANGAVLYTTSGASAARFERSIACGMPGVNVAVPSPVAYYSFAGAGSSLRGDAGAHGPDAINFFTRRQVLSTRF